MDLSNAKHEKIHQWFNEKVNSMGAQFLGLSSLEDLRQSFPVDAADCEVTANEDVAPSQEILAIVRKRGKNRVDRFHWGLVPHWAKDVSIGISMINARAETIAEKPSFRDAFIERRCLIPATGFYELKNEKGDKIPVLFTLPNGGPFAFAGLWEIWTKKGGTGFVYKSCTMITTKAAVSVRDIHHRMPVILKPDMYGPWLDHENQSITALKQILQDGIVTDLTCFPLR
jgi:putative SOS response-associated peptidase YedK